MVVVDRVQVFLGKWDRDARSGPFIGVREESLLAYTLRLPEEFIPWPGQELAETVLVDLDVGVSMSKPCWRWRQGADGERVGGIDAELPEPATWYVDLVLTHASPDRIDVLDLYIDLMVATDGRQARMLDLDEFGDALALGKLTSAQAADGLRRWQRFLGTYIYPDSEPRHEFADFPPSRFTHLADGLGKPS